MASRRELSRVIEGSIDSDLSLSFDEGEKVGRQFDESKRRKDNNNNSRVCVDNPFFSSGNRAWKT